MIQPKVGMIAEVTWIDSGFNYNGAGVELDDMALVDQVTFGEILAVRDNEIIIGCCLHADGFSADNDDVYVIWRPAIRSITPLASAR